MSEFEVLFEQMSKAGITTTEHESGQAFFARAKKWLAVTSEDTKPCECFE